MSETKIVETTTFDDGSEIVTTKVEETEYIEGDNPSASIEASEVVADAVEEIADAEIVIASIEAEKEVAIAEIHADVAIAEIEARERENNEWNSRLTSLEDQNRKLMEEVETLKAAVLLSPHSLPSEQLEEIVEEVEAEILEDLILPSTLAPTSETMTEASQESGEESLVPPLVEIDTGGRKRVIRLI